MIVRIVRMTFQKDQLEAFEALFVGHRDAIAQQPGCLGVEWITDPEAPVSYTHLTLPTKA